MRRRKDKVDANQAEIVKALRKIAGIHVEVGHDDILVGFCGRTYWYEIKDESAVSAKTGEILESKKKPAQIRLEKEWPGHYKIVWNIDQILSDIGIEHTPAGH